MTIFPIVNRQRIAMAMFPILGFDWSVPNPLYVSSPVSSKPSKYLTELEALGFRNCGENCLKYVVYDGKSFKKNDAIGVPPF